MYNLGNLPYSWNRFMLVPFVYGSTPCFIIPIIKLFEVNFRVSDSKTDWISLEILPQYWILLDPFHPDLDVQAVSGSNLSLNSLNDNNNKL